MILFLSWQRCLDAMDDTLMDAVFRNQHGWIAQNVLCIYDFNIKFTFVYTGSEGTEYDARVFFYVLSERSAHFPWPPEGKLFILLNFEWLIFCDYFFFLLFSRFCFLMHWGIFTLNPDKGIKRVIVIVSVNFESIKTTLITIIPHFVIL